MTPIWGSGLDQMLTFHSIVNIQWCNVLHAEIMLASFPYDETCLFTRVLIFQTSRVASICITTLEKLKPQSVWYVHTRVRLVYAHHLNQTASVPMSPTVLCICNWHSHLKPDDMNIDWWYHGSNTVFAFMRAPHKHTHTHTYTHLWSLKTDYQTNTKSTHQNSKQFRLLFKSTMHYKYQESCLLIPRADRSRKWGIKNSEVIIQRLLIML